MCGCDRVAGGAVIVYQTQIKINNMNRFIHVYRNDEQEFKRWTPNIILRKQIIEYISSKLQGSSICQVDLLNSWICWKLRNDIFHGTSQQ